MTATADLPALLGAWVAARSVARGLPAPVAEKGGWRVDTRSDAEECRWVFPHMSEGLCEVGREVDRPRRLIKLCGTVDELAGALPSGWSVTATGAFMRFDGEFGPASPPSGYSFEIQRDGDVACARILIDGEAVATGYAAATDQAFIFDRIMVHPAHRRRGLASALIAGLTQGSDLDRRKVLLVASVMGVALYERLGWTNLSPYSTAEFAGVSS